MSNLNGIFPQPFSLYTFLSNTGCKKYSFYLELGSLQEDIESYFSSEFLAQSREGVKDHIVF